MAASQTYPNLLTHGVTSGGDVGPVFELFAGDTPNVATDQGQAADGQAITQFQVLMHDAEGKLIPFTISDNYSTGTVNITSTGPINADTLTINAEVITFVTSGATGDQVNIGGTITVLAAAVAAIINSDPERFGVTAVAALGVVTLTAIAVGTGAITTTESATNLTVSGATLTGGDTTADTPSNEAVAIAAQPVVAATPGAFVPVYVAGCFNHEALSWPAGLATLRTRKLAFAGTGIVVKQLL